MINKTVKNVAEACAGVESGMTLMLGGFGLCGIPECAIGELQRLVTITGNTFFTATVLTID